LYDHVLFLDVGIVVVLLFVELRLMFLEECSLRFLELTLLLFFLNQQVLVPRSIFEHFLTVLIATSFKLFVLLLIQLFDLLFKSLLHLNLAVVELIMCITGWNLGRSKLVSQFLNAFLLGSSPHLLINTWMTRILMVVQISNKLELLGFIISNFLLFSQYFLWERNHRSSISLANESASGVLVLDVKNHKRAIATCCEKEVVVEGDTHALNSSIAVSLNFIKFFKGEFPNLDGPRAVFFANTSEESFATCHNLDLANNQLGANIVLSIRSFENTWTTTDDQSVIRRARDVSNICKPSKCVVVSALVEIFILVALVRFFLLLKIVEVNVTVEGARGESHIILEPVNTAYFWLMALALQVGGVLTGVKVVNVNVGSSHGGGKHMTTVTELNFAAALCNNCLVFFDTVRQNVHQLNLVIKSNNNVETAGMEGHGLGLFTSLADVRNF
jgi:hypothetical protein